MELGNKKDDLILTFSVFIDDAPLFAKSLNAKVNAIFLCINELPPSLRFKKSNMICFGVYQVRDIQNNSIYKPFVTCLQFGFIMEYFVIK